jgi:hypothetical protein
LFGEEFKVITTPREYVRVSGNLLHRPNLCITDEKEKAGEALKFDTGGILSPRFCEVAATPETNSASRPVQYSSPQTQVFT